ncbi:MAG: MarR family transcriptional regulator [Candidatus Methanosuratincola sp.]
MSVAVLAQGLEQLRSVDRMIDLSKSTLQLDIMLAINNRGEASPAEIASAIGQRRKAVTDALRKLRNKGLVELTNEGSRTSTYILTEDGKNTISTLYRFVAGEKLSNPAGAARVEPQRHQPARAALNNESGDPKSQIGTQLPLAVVLSRVLFALGMSKGNCLSLKSLSDVMGLSQQRTESYLEAFMNWEPKLFRRYMDETAWAKVLRRLGLKGGAKHLEPVYALTQEGMQHFYRLPSYMRLKRSFAYRVLRRITNTPDPRGIFRRIMFFLVFSQAISLLGFISFLNPLITSFWLLLGALIGVFALVNGLICRLSDLM